MSEKAIANVTPVELLNIAVAKEADVDQMARLFELQVAWEKNEAMKMYSSAMVEVQNKIPVVVKGLRNKQTSSNYAALDEIIKETKAIYTEAGFSVSFYEGDTAKEGYVRVCADVLHRAGHKETYHFDAPLDGVGIKGNANMTAIHAKASSTTYARRYLMVMIWNIPTADDDGNMAGVETISESQLAEIKALAQEVGVNLKDKAFLAYCKVDSITNLPAKQFKAVIAALEKKR